MQDQLFRNILGKLSSKQSLHKVVAETLQISYDAAHRRISGKAQLSFSEAVILSSNFNTSLDNLLTAKDSQKLILNRSLSIKTLQDFEDYLKHTLNQLKQVSRQGQLSLTYSAKDIPLFYSLGDSLLARFKVFVWLKLLSPEFDKSHTKFSSFALPPSLVVSAKQLQQFYNHIKINEIWNTTTIVSTLQQILYFWESGFINQDDAVKLSNDLKTLIKSIQERLEHTINNKTEDYQLFINELLIMNNNVFAECGSQKAVFVPHSVLGYWTAQDAQVCEEASAYFRHQINNSQSLNSSGQRERQQFFNKIYRRIENQSNFISTHQEI